MRLNFIQTIGVSQRAFAFETRRAIEIEADDFGLITQRRCVVGAGRAVHSGKFAVERGSKVHEAAVVANHVFGAGQ